MRAIELAAAASAAEQTCIDWEAASLMALPEAHRIDCRCHLGLDADGRSLSTAELTEQLERAQVQEALVAPLHHTEGYRQANPELVAWADADSRLHAMWRLDPNGADPRGQAEEGFAAGAAGLKLHPRAEQFALDAPGVRAALEVVDEQGSFVLIHAGRRIPALGERTIRLARAFPSTRFVLAHAAISDLSWVVEAAAELPNIVYDSSWWNPIDLVLRPANSYIHNGCKCCALRHRKRRRSQLRLSFPASHGLIFAHSE